MSESARMAALFDVVATSYDDVGVDFFQPIAGGLVAAMPPRPGERWLDVGCGRGAVLLRAAEGVGAHGQAVGIDISPAMVEQARLAARGRGLDNVRVSVGDAMAPALPGERFDTISSCLVLFFLPDPAAALVAWRDRLAPGGRLGVTTFGPTDPRWEHVDEVFEPYLPPDTRHGRTRDKKAPFATDAGMESLVREAGFTEVRTVTGTIPVRFASLEQWQAFSMSTGQRLMWQSVPRDRRPEVLAEAGRRLGAHAAPDGSVVFEQPIRHTLAVHPHPGSLR